MRRTGALFGMIWLVTICLGKPVKGLRDSSRGFFFPEKTQLK
jgi:hypothetical protein